MSNVPVEIQLSPGRDQLVGDPEGESVEGKYREMEQNQRAIIIENLRK